MFLGLSCFDEVQSEATTVLETPVVEGEAKTDAAAVEFTEVVPEVIHVQICSTFFRWL